MRTLLLISILILPLFSNAQVERLPEDSLGNAAFSFTVDAYKIPQPDLYEVARKWVHTELNCNEKFIVKEDKDSGILIVTGKVPGVWGNGSTSFSLKIDVNDGNYSHYLGGFVYHSTNKYDGATPDKMNRVMWNYYKRDLKSKMYVILGSLREEMTNPMNFVN